MKLCFFALLGLLGPFALISGSHAQAVYSGERTARIQAGAGGMYLRNDYSPKAAYGLSAWGDFDFSRFVGAEVETHFGGIISPDDIGENSYLVGPRVTYRRGKNAFFGKLLVGRGMISNQIYNTSSTFNLYAFGGGVDYRVSRRYRLRLEAEEQKWPDFERNTLSPLAVTVGVLYVIR